MIEDAEFIKTDLRLFVRRFRFNIYVHYDSGYDDQPYYLRLTGTHKALIRGEIFLKFQLVEGTQHRLIVYRCEKKQQPETVKQENLEVARGCFQGM